MKEIFFIALVNNDSELWYRDRFPIEAEIGFQFQLRFETARLRGLSTRSFGCRS